MDIPSLQLQNLKTKKIYNESIKQYTAALNGTNIIFPQGYTVPKKILEGSINGDGEIIFYIELNATVDPPKFCTVTWLDDDGTEIEKDEFTLINDVIKKCYKGDTYKTIDNKTYFREWVGFTEGMVANGDVTFKARYVDNQGNLAPQTPLKNLWSQRLRLKSLT